MDIGRAYTFITSDPKWIAKILIGAAVSLVPLLNLALYGYALDVLKRVYQGNELPLPEWDDFGDYFIRGLLVSIGIVIWELPLFLLACPIVALAIIDNSGVAVLLGLACLIPLGIVYAAITCQIVAARYALSGEFSSMFEFGAVFAEARRGAGPLLLCALIYAAASVAGMVAGVVTCFVGLFIVGPWLTLAQAHLLGQAYRGVRNLPPTTATAF
ncbi:MAG TPA: DUF4013 domain-containing protein [Thermomicrobiales bacterium]|nr:DUF4013 domain-containing protein [Thermomicrobiales bacterium]